MVDLCGRELQLDGPAGIVLPTGPSLSAGRQFGQFAADGDAEGRVLVEIEVGTGGSELRFCTRKTRTLRIEWNPEGGFIM